MRLPPARLHRAVKIQPGLKEVGMLRWAIGFFIVALIAALLGFGGLAATAAGIAKFIFYIFIILFVLSLIAHLMRGTKV